MKRRGQALFYGITAVLFALVYFSAAVPFMTNAISAAAPFMSVNAQILASLIIAAIPLAILLGFWKTINPSGT